MTTLAVVADGDIARLVCNALKLRFVRERQLFVLVPPATGESRWVVCIVSDDSNLYAPAVEFAAGALFGCGYGCEVSGGYAVQSGS